MERLTQVVPIALVPRDVWIVCAVGCAIVALIAVYIVRADP